MAKNDDAPIFGVPAGECRSEVPDGITTTRGYFPHNNLQDETGRPALQSGDWQVVQPKD